MYLVLNRSDVAQLPPICSIRAAAHGGILSAGGCRESCRVGAAISIESLGKLSWVLIGTRVEVN